MILFELFIGLAALWLFINLANFFFMKVEGDGKGPLGLSQKWLKNQPK